MSTAESIAGDTPAARLGDTVVSLREALRTLHHQGQLVPWLREAVRRTFLLDQARAAGLTVSEDELQSAADRYRQRNGLFSASDTFDWLSRNSLSKTAFEAALEQEVLLEKLKRHVTEPLIAERFASRLDDHDRLGLILLVLPHEELAREILTQVVEEGADLGDLARRHSQHPSRSDGGRVGPLFRSRLPGPLGEALAGVPVGTLVGPIKAAEGFYVVRLEELAPGTLDATTRAVLVEELFDEWLQDRLGQAAFSAPILNDLA